MAPRTRKPHLIPLEPISGSDDREEIEYDLASQQQQQQQQQQQHTLHNDNDDVGSDDEFLSDEEEDASITEHFRGHVPVKAIILAVALLLIGGVLLAFGLYNVYQWWDTNNDDVPTSGKKDTSINNAIPFLLAGLVTFIPGLWASRIAVLACIGDPSTSFRDLPDF
jgi:hypothetical protein